MGKTIKPLKILLSPDCITTDEDQGIIEKLQGQGHTVHIMGYELCPSCRDGMAGYDIVGGPNAFRMFDLKYLPVAILGARKMKYKKGNKINE
jgi:hypothetical protein